MSDKPKTPASASSSSTAAGFRPELFAKKAEQAAREGQTKSDLPPVHLWNPEFCGDIDMEIRRDGSWYYMGTPISRPAMVRLFSTILRHDEDGKYYLVTPVEKVGIRVEDKPFVAVEMTREGEGREQILRFRTNVDDDVTADADHPIRVEVNPETGEPSPYLLVRDRLEALISRAVYYELANLVEKKDNVYGVWSAGCFFPLAQVEQPDGTG
ncbi:DUF1285 domain-containing protein [Luteithermobacter gelatinilyticus]|uniref:DUF1285 domain-containing protein n=1 Tax=Luteithermobacter gelatinilyticus TaxID=2582913 RepID=UPI00110721A5|nr:DUF1285 domain-containing protein [Luteithermobacter gelatinilyticus]